MNLREVRPRLQPIVLSKAKSVSLRNKAFQPAPSPHSRAASVSSNDPARLYFIPAGHHALFIKSRYRRIPPQGNSAVAGSLHHSLVQHFPAYSQAVPVRKISAHRRLTIFKLNATKRAAILFAQCHAKLAERLYGIGQEPFSACLKALGELGVALREEDGCALRGIQ